jgi:hypothetical protein
MCDFYTLNFTINQYATLYITVHQFERGDIVARKGTFSKEMFFIASGVVTKTKGTTLGENVRG